ncbi:unnamed protein product [Camellia sinensis]
MYVGYGTEGSILILQTCLDHLNIHGKHLKNTQLEPIFEGSKLSMKKGKLAKSKLTKSKSKCKSAKCKSTKVSLMEFDNQGDAQISTDEMPDVLPRRSTRIQVAPKSLISGDFVGPWQRLSNENKRGLRDVESKDSSIECDCVGLCLCGNLGTPRLQMNVEMQASTEQSSKQHQIPNAWNTPTRVLTDLEQWPRLAIVSLLAANEMIMSKKLGSPNVDHRREVIDIKQRKSVENVRACSNEDLAELHMEDTQYGKDECLDGDTTAILGKPLQAWSSLLKEEINKVSKMKYKVGAHKIENLVDGMYNVPIEISKKGFSHWENALVGYFIDKRFSFHYVKTWAEKLWENLLEDVVSIDNGLIVVKKWQPRLKLTKCEFSSVPLWVKLYNVPLELWTEEGLGYIASIIGTPLYLDEPTFKRNRLTFARICIEVPANKEIPKSFKINFGYGDPYEIQVEVPWKPQRCDGCKTFGHTTNLCPQKPKTLNPPSSKQEWRVKETNIQVPTKWEMVKKKGRDGGQGSTTVINKKAETQCFTPSTSNAFDVLESCDMGELGNGELNQELLCQTKSLQSRGGPSPSDPINEETTKEDNRRKLKAKLHYLKKNPDIRMCGKNFCMVQIGELFANPMLSLVQLKNGDHFILAPLFSDELHEATFLRSLVLFEGDENDFDAVLAEMEKEMSMSDIMKELGYGCTVNVSRCVEMLSLFLPLTEITVSRILGTIARTHAGLEDNQNAFSTFYYALGTDSSSDLPLMSSWNIDVLIDSIKQLAPETNWISVVENLDHEGFYFPNEAAFSFFMSVYKRACQGTSCLYKTLKLTLQDPFPLHAICGSVWKNTEGQLSFLKNAVAVPPEVFTFANAGRQLVYVDAVHGLKFQPGHVNHAWLCLDLLEVLCLLAERGHASTVQSMLKHPLEHCPEVLLLGMAHINTAYNFLQYEVSLIVFAKILKNSTGSDARNIDPDDISRVLDICQEL